MSLKLLVNTPNLYEALQEELSEWLRVEIKSLSTASEPHLVYRHQGAVKILQRLGNLRDEVNKRK